LKLIRRGGEAAAKPPTATQNLHEKPREARRPCSFNLRNPAINGNGVSFDLRDGQQGGGDFTGNGEIIESLLSAGRVRNRIHGFRRMV